MPLANDYIQHSQPVSSGMFQAEISPAVEDRAGLAFMVRMAMAGVAAGRKERMCCPDHPFQPANTGQAPIDPTEDPGWLAAWRSLPVPASPRRAGFMP